MHHPSITQWRGRFAWPAATLGNVRWLLRCGLLVGSILLAAGCPPDLDAFLIVRDAEPPAERLLDAGHADAGRLDARMGGPDSGEWDGGRDGGVDAGVRDAGGEIGDAGRDASSDLHPDLPTADPSGEPCTTPGSLSECPSTEVCRFYTSTESRCESCEPCGNLGDPCTQSSHCDIVLVCFRGECTNFCSHEYGCSGVPEWCLDVGHPTHGVCEIP